MTRMTPAELRQLCIDNPDFAARNAQELKKLTGSVLSDDARKLNPGVGSISSAAVDAAQTLYDQMRVHAPDVCDWFIREYHFENFRIDLADPQHMIAIEVDGGQFKPGGGKHGSKRDYQKTRRIAAAKWTLLRFTAEEVNDNPLGVIAEIREALCKS